MDVILETQKGVSFTIEIGYFDTVLEIKEKIQKFKNIPISQQTLVLDGKVLEDEGNVESCDILHNSRILLIVSNHHEKSHDKLKPKVEEQQSSIPKKTQILLKFPNKKPPQFSMDVDLNDTVEQLKEKLHQIEGIPTNRLALYVNGNNEVQDNRHLREYELTDGSEIEVSIRQFLTPTTSGMTHTTTTTTTTTGSKKLKVFVLSKCGTKRLVVEVNPTDKVQVLRNELEKVQQRMNFELPSEGYFFIYNQSVMEERESFQWHNVRHGDAIEIFNGTVTGGS